MVPYDESGGIKMKLIICSIFLGFLGLMLGSRLGDAGAFIFAAIGFLCPALYVLNELYKKSKEETLSK